MLINFSLFLFYSLLSALAVLGYGFFFQRIYLEKQSNENIGMVGFLGLFFLSIISTTTHLIISHNSYHNLFLLFIGLILFFYLGEKKSLKLFLYCIVLLILGYFISKTNEDFSYYHLPNSLQFSENKLQFGLGNLNHGFKHYSSLFQLNSIFYYPKIKFYLFNLTDFLFLIFAACFLLKKIFSIKSIKYSFINTFYIFSLILILTKFSRIAEYGTDIPGQILILIAILVSANLLFTKQNNIEYYNNFLVLVFLLIFSITIKIYFIIYCIIPLFIILRGNKKIQTFKNLFKFKNILVITVPIILLIIMNLSSTGCFVYPLEKTCFPEYFDWGLPKETVKILNSHYELWSKGGRTPNYIVENPSNFVAGINWVSHWIQAYFFTKVSDFLLVIFSIIIVFSLLFFSSLKKFGIKKIHDFNFFYFLLLSIFAYWFFNFPTLRYGGYVIVATLFFLAYSYFFTQNINYGEKKNKKKIFFLIGISFLIFNYKNISRIDNEFQNEYVENFKNFPLFYVKKTNYNEVLINQHRLFLLKKGQSHCWATPSTCIRSSNLIIKKNKNYIFYINNEK